MSRRHNIKNTKDKRYLRVQEAIQRGMSKFIRRGHVAGLRVSEVSKEANIYASTFYDHHDNLDDAVVALDNCQNADLAKIVAEAKKDQLSLTILYSRLLYFICKHKDYYSTLVKSNNIHGFLIVILAAKPAIEGAWKENLVRYSDYKFTISAFTLTGELWWWAKKEKFSEDKITKLARRLEALTCGVEK